MVVLYNMSVAGVRVVEFGTNVTHCSVGLLTRRQIMVGVGSPCATHGR